MSYQGNHVSARSRASALKNDTAMTVGRKCRRPRLMWESRRSADRPIGLYASRSRKGSWKYTRTGRVMRIVAGFAVDFALAVVAFVGMVAVSLGIILVLLYVFG